VRRKREREKDNAERRGKLFGQEQLEMIDRTVRGKREKE
jgi:hypothetical protein